MDGSFIRGDNLQFQSVVLKKKCLEFEYEKVYYVKHFKAD